MSSRWLAPRKHNLFTIGSIARAPGPAAQTAFSPIRATPLLCSLLLAVFAWPALSLSSENSTGPIAATSNVTCVAARPEGPPPTARLVAAYGFEEISGNKTPDSSGKSHPAALVNAVLTTGRFGKGIVLNGTNAYVRIDEPSWPRRDYNLCGLGVSTHR